MNKNHTIAILAFNNHEITLKLIKDLREKNNHDKLLILDNGSNPSFEGLIKDDNFEYYRNETNNFVNPSWNQVFELTKTKYLTLLNNDCFIESDNYFNEVIHHMDTHKISISSCRTKNITHYSTLSIMYHKFLYFIFNYQKELKYKLNPRRQGWLMTINLDDYKKCDYKIPDYIRIWYGDDWIFNQIRLNNLKYIVYLNRYALHVKGNTTSKLSNIIKEDIKNIEKQGLWYHESTKELHAKKYV